MKITLFPSARDPMPVGYCSFLDLYKKMSEDETLLAQAKEIERLASTDQKGYEALKAKLPAFCIGRFDSREEGAMPTSFEPVLCFDLDHIEQPLVLLESLKLWPYTWICYPSPSMKGLRVMVKVDCSPENRSDVYDVAAKSLSTYTSVRLEEDVQKELRKTTPIINTSTKNINRLWFYTGVHHFYGNRKAKVFGEKPKVTYAPRPAPATVSPANISAEEVEALVSEIERRKIDITSDYDSWMRAGMGLANELGENGREAFHKISSFHPDYKFRATDRKYDNLIATNKGNISLATLFKLAKDSGIEFTFQPRHERQFPEAKFNDRGAETLLNAFLAMHMDNMGEILSRVPSLSEACFRDGANKGVFQAIKFMSEKSQFIDPVTVHERVNGFYSDIREDCKEVVTLEAAVGYAELIVGLHRKSEATKLLLEMSNRVASGEDVDTVIMSLDTANLSVGATEEDDSIKLAVYKSSKRREELFHRMVKTDSAIPGRTTGIRDEDMLSGGRQDGKLVIIAGRPGQGKCLGKGTKVLMFDGSLKNAEDVVVGDLLMGDDSMPRNVLSLARGQQNMYWVRQKQGIDYRVNESHILSLKRSRTEHRYKNGDVLNIGLRDYIGSSNKFKTNYKGYKVPVEFTKKEVELDPYFVGLWLGDGTSSNSSITSMDNEIVSYLEELSLSMGLELRKNSKSKNNAASTYSVTQGKYGKRTPGAIYTLLGNYNLINNKHIPDDYLVNSTENRLLLLAGLLDSDGHCCRDYNCFEITQKNENLARQIKFLCDTLGFKTSMTPKRASIKSIGYECTVFRVRIYGDIDKIPNKLPRKMAKQKLGNHSWRHTGVTVEFDCFDDYYGFEIDGNKLFLLEDMTVTHNSSKMMCEALAIAESGSPVGIISLEMPKEELIDRLVCAKAKVSSEKLANPTLIDFENREDARMQIAEDEINTLPLYIVDEEFHWNAIKRRIKKWASMGVKDVYIDYLQLITNDSKKGENREQEVSKMSRALKEMAKKLKICITPLAQLSRAVETRGRDRRPQLSDLRESGALEQDADVVVFCYRPEYYKIMSDTDGFSTVDTCELIYAKHRGGRCDTVLVGAQMKYFWFGDLGQRSFVERAKVPRNRPIPGAKEIEEEEEDDDYSFPELRQGEFDFDDDKPLF